MSIVNRPLRVMHIISGDLWAGAEAQAYTLLSQLRGRVDLMVVVLNTGELANRLTKGNIPLLILPESSLSSLAIFSRLVRAIFSFKPDVVHTHRQKENILGGLAFVLNRIIGRAKISVRTAHGAPEFTPTGIGRIQATLNVAIGRWVQQAVIAVSEDLRGKLLPVFGPEKLVLVRNGVDCRALRELSLPIAPALRNYDVGIIGRLEPVKRVDLFLRMAAQLLAQAPDIPWRFHIIGDGNLAPSLKKLAEELGVLAHLDFHGHISTAAPYLAGLKVLIMCSDHEGTPMTALEAMALGVPVIAHKVGGLEELLSAQPRGLVVQHTHEGYAQALLDYARNPFAAIPLPAEYTAECNAGHIYALYRRLLGIEVL
ncbi:MAG: hypothetical protein RL497_1493 [Pseudomonadota bacterium]|jgi:glycosyltransferase involved in cell wall biosynthesis